VCWAKNAPAILLSPEIECVTERAGPQGTLMTAAAPPLLSDTHRLNLLIDASSGYGLSVLDSAGFVTSWSPSAEAVVGYTASEAIGLHFSQFFGVQDRNAGMPTQILDAARQAGRREFEGWRSRKDGNRFWGSSVVRALRDDEGALIGFAEIIQDITERVAARNTLIESDRRFRTLVEGVVDYAICMLDADGIVTSWNMGGQRLQGFRADEIIGRHFSEFYSAEDRADGLPERAIETATSEGRLETEGWRIRKDGSRFWASVVIDAVRNEAGRLEGFAQLTRDITERRNAQEALRESERQFRLLVAGVTDYALYMLDPDGVITSWNAGARRIKGYARHEVIGEHFSRFYTERDRSVNLPQRALEEAAKTGRFIAEGWRVRKDGQMFWAGVVINPIRDETGKLVGFAKITRDLTERREAQIALQEAQARRAHLQKMDALGQLTGGVAHDFNNLLMVVSGHIPTIRKTVGDDPRAARAVDAIDTAARRGAALTRQLLSFSRRQTFNPMICRIDERLDSIREMLAGSIAALVTLSIDADPQAWTVRVDASELDLALVNVALNARDAMPAGGQILMTARNVVLSRADTRAEIEGEFLAVRVADTGSGIPPDVMGRVFDPFFTTKPANKGSGLGLSQVYGFAHQSGGTVTIDSELGKGTIVTLYLPRAVEVANDDRPDARDPIAADGLVLLVEDNPDVAEVSASMLEQLGYRVRAVGDASGALEAVEEENFDLVVSDIVMAGLMDGMQLAREIRQRKPTLPVLLVTGYSHSAAGAGGEFPVLRKPFELGDLSRMASRAIADSREAGGRSAARLGRAD
jgi:PAS domain S-box-containing protein